uniref:Uncharacterized protein n=1 Tax=Globodera rostochiensis TaxID=31243 RepID=A0A914HTI3_GLORO
MLLKTKAKCIFFRHCICKVVHRVRGQNDEIGIKTANNQSSSWRANDKLCARHGKVVIGDLLLLNQTETWKRYLAQAMKETMVVGPHYLDMETSTMRKAYSTGMDDPEQLQQKGMNLLRQNKRQDTPSVTSQFNCYLDSQSRMAQGLGGHVSHCCGNSAHDMGWETLNGITHLCSAPYNRCRTDKPKGKSSAKMFLQLKFRTTFDLLRAKRRPIVVRDEEMEKRFNRRHGAKPRPFDVDAKVFGEKDCPNPGEPTTSTHGWE